MGSAGEDANGKHRIGRHATKRDKRDETYMSTAKQANVMSAVELLSLFGFSLCVAWAFLSFFWLFRDFPPDVPLAVRDMVQFAIFAGVPSGLGLLYLLGRSPRFSLFSNVSMGCETLVGALLPILAFAMYQHAHIPLPVVVGIGFLSGMAGGMIVTSWLDVLSRLRTTFYGRFTGLAFIGGALLFALAALAPNDLQPVFSFAYVLLGGGLLAFATQNADGNSDRAPLEATPNPWTFTKEIEPSFFVFGIVFALNFVFLFNAGQEALLPGLLSVIPGAAVVAALSIAQKQVGITVVQRVLLIITVLSCVLMPFSRGVLQIGCACLVVAAWGAFKAVNFAFMVRKSVIVRDAPLFRQAPLRLAVSSLGFAVGWGIATVITMVAGPHSEPFTTVRLAMAFVLVVVVMAFFPIGKHHPVDGSAEQAGSPSEPVYAVSMDESELFERRCAAIAKLYQLSPRETDILAYLARGRNAAWIQDELTISPHTVKSHIYNIYRKLDIHSQQKLMSFVEDYPIDPKG